MHIVYLVQSIQDISGGMRVIFEHVNRLSRIGHNVEVWTTNQEGVPHFDTTCTVRAYQKSELDAPDVVVMTDPGFIPDVSEQRRSSSTYLLVQHDLEWVTEVLALQTHANLIGKRREYFRSGKCTLLVVSSWLQDVMKHRYDLDSVLIRNGVDSATFRPSKPVLNLKNPAMLVFYDPQVWKGFGEAIAAYMEVTASIPDLQIVIVGRYFPEMPKAEGMSFGFSFPTVYFNSPSQNVLGPIYSSATFLVTASWKEGFGLPGLEAMACGVPVIAAEAGGNMDYVIPGQNALTFQPGDIRSIIKSIKLILTDEKLRSNLISAGRRTAKEFSWDRTIKLLDAEFEKNTL